MIAEKINNSHAGVRVLVAPLDWGLGHATRCIPIIHTLLQHNVDVVLAASGVTKILLQKEFPQLAIFNIPSYKIKYSAKKNFFLWSIFRQLPHILRTIREEHLWLKDFVERENINGVIADNRPGLYCKGISSVYITHQLQIQTHSQLLGFVRRLHYRFINKFDYCWVPDVAGENNMAGHLSHPVHLPIIPVQYIGLLSRFQKKKLERKYDLLLLLSGPEPQRTMLENLLLASIDKDSNFILVRGLPNGRVPTSLPAEIYFDHLESNELSELIQQCEMVIARAGYSTIMDLLTLQQKALLIPTPGQTEQKYLGQYLSGRKIFGCIEQSQIAGANLSRHLSMVPEVPAIQFPSHEKVILDWLNDLR